MPFPAKTEAPDRAEMANVIKNILKMKTVAV
jgi:hypothetical protein